MNKKEPAHSSPFSDALLLLVAVGLVAFSLVLVASMTPKDDLSINLEWAKQGN